MRNLKILGKALCRFIGRTFRIQKVMQYMLDLTLPIHLAVSTQNRGGIGIKNNPKLIVELNWRFEEYNNVSPFNPAASNGNRQGFLMLSGNEDFST